VVADVVRGDLAVPERPAGRAVERDERDRVEVGRPVSG
jgi:hypothetical protein